MTSPETVASERKRARKETVTVRRDMFLDYSPAKVVTWIRRIFGLDKRGLLFIEINIQ